MPRCSCGSPLRFEYAMYLTTKNGEIFKPLVPGTAIAIIYCPGCGWRTLWRNYMVEGRGSLDSKVEDEGEA